MKSQSNTPLHVFALCKRTHVVTHIHDVASGDEQCVCIECGCRLIPKKGAQLAHHFAHYNATECIAGNHGGAGKETIFHLLLKESIYHSSKIPFVINDLLEDTALLLGLRPYILGSHLRFDVQAMERKLTTSNECNANSNTKYQPDVTGKLLGRKLAIEVTYRHKTSEMRKRNLLDADIDTIEIRLDKNRLPDIETLVELRRGNQWETIFEAFSSCIHYLLPERWQHVKTARMKAKQHIELAHEVELLNQQKRQLINEKNRYEKRFNAELSAHDARAAYFEKYYGGAFSRVEELELLLNDAESRSKQLSEKLAVTSENFENLKRVFLKENPEANVCDLIEQQRHIDISDQIKKDMQEDSL